MIKGRDMMTRKSIFYAVIACFSILFLSFTGTKNNEINHETKPGNKLEDNINDCSKGHERQGDQIIRLQRQSSADS